MFSGTVHTTQRWQTGTRNWCQRQQCNEKEETEASWTDGPVQSPADGILITFCARLYSTLSVNLTNWGTSVHLINPLIRAPLWRLNHLRFYLLLLERFLRIFKQRKPSLVCNTASTVVLTNVCVNCTKTMAIGMSCIAAPGYENVTLSLSLTSLYLSYLPLWQLI